MNTDSIFTSFFALLFVLCLIGLAGLLLRKYGNGFNISAVKGPDKRLKLKESLNIDAKRKVVLISRDDKEYLVAFNDNAIELLDKEVKKKNPKKK